jgi:hypothetical protein
MPRKSSRRSFDLPHFNSTAPPTPPESIKDFRTDSNITLVDDDKSSTSPVTCTHRISSLPSYLLDWTLKLIGAACAIVFGVWAPLSYKLQKDGNKGNDKAQEDLKREIEALGIQLKLLASLKAYEFCESKVSLKVGRECGADGCAEIGTV